MNREIKFRAWDKISEEMYRHYSYKDKKGRLVVEWEGHDVDVVLMQYTGLKDKNGKEIYEGDILKEGGEVRFGKLAVQWEGEGKYYPILWHTYKKPRNIFDRSSYPLEEGDEVIGNIYQN